MLTAFALKGSVLERSGLLCDTCPPGKTVGFRVHFLHAGTWRGTLIDAAELAKGEEAAATS